MKAKELLNKRILSHVGVGNLNEYKIIEFAETENGDYVKLKHADEDIRDIWRNLKDIAIIAVLPDENKKCNCGGKCSGGINFEDLEKLHDDYMYEIENALPSKHTVIKFEIKCFMSWLKSRLIPF